LQKQPDNGPEVGTPLAVDYSCLSRFIFDKRHFSISKRVPKASAFNDPTLRPSAFWIDELLDGDIWKIGDTVAGVSRNRPAIARADFNKSDVSVLKLTIEPDATPHPRHVELCGWPTEKDERIALALELCVRSQLRLRDA
jgi:hypothetical protein